ncbi:MAG TPA: hypothetical protein VGV18_07955 [Verrucomicrobiae bacterium]|nr:hypothetical protein [Verrucomicrobiae bacterium]
MLKNRLSEMGDHHPGQTQLANSQIRGTLEQTHARVPGPTGQNAALGGGGAALGANVVQFARQRTGQKVGDGECFALADQALRSAGAKSAADFGAITPNGDYKWSSQQVSPTDAKPGDIIQFRNFRVVIKTVHADGSWEERSEERPHHTAVVVSNDGSGNLTVLEQNVSIGGSAGQAQKTVRQNKIVTTAGSHKAGADNVTVTVTGRIVVYRPVT